MVHHHRWRIESSPTSAAKHTSYISIIYQLRTYGWRHLGSSLATTDYDRPIIHGWIWCTKSITKRCLWVWHPITINVRRDGSSNASTSEGHENLKWCTFAEYRRRQAILIQYILVTEDGWFVWCDERDGSIDGSTMEPYLCSLCNNQPIIKHIVAEERGVWTVPWG